MTHHYRRVVHSTPMVLSTDRMHELVEDCWCQPVVVDCFAERMVIHRDEHDGSIDRWWVPITDGRTPEECRYELAHEGGTRGIFNQCAVGQHFECSDWSGSKGCKCRCHEIAEEAITEARKNGDLL